MAIQYHQKVRVSYRLRNRAIICMAATAITVLLGSCTTMDITEDKAQAIDSYQFKAEKSGLFIAVNPLTEVKVEETFNIDLLDKGILPILVVIENRSASTSFILTKDKVAILDREAIETLKFDRTKVTSESTGASIAAVGAGLISLPLVFVGLKMASDATVIQHNLGVKQFQSRTLGPGQKAHGYIYYQYPKGDSEKLNDLHVLIEATDSSNFQPIMFDLPIKYSNR